VTKRVAHALLRSMCKSGAQLNLTSAWNGTGKCATESRVRFVLKFGGMKNSNTNKMISPSCSTTSQLEIADKNLYEFLRCSYQYYNLLIKFMLGGGLGVKARSYMSGRWFEF
jgi:hypothetical protein